MCYPPTNHPTSEFLFTILFYAPHSRVLKWLVQLRLLFKLVMVCSICFSPKFPPICTWTSINFTYISVIVDEVFRRKLLMDGEGMGDDRRINILLRTFFKWNDAKDESPEEV